MCTFLQWAMPWWNMTIIWLNTMLVMFIYSIDVQSNTWHKRYHWWYKCIWATSNSHWLFSSRAYCFHWGVAKIYPLIQEAVNCLLEGPLKSNRTDKLIIKCVPLAYFILLAYHTRQHLIHNRDTTALCWAIVMLYNQHRKCQGPIASLNLITDSLP